MQGDREREHKIPYVCVFSLVHPPLSFSLSVWCLSEQVLEIGSLRNILNDYENEMSIIRTHHYRVLDNQYFQQQEKYILFVEKNTIYIFMCVCRSRFISYNRKLAIMISFVE